MGERELMFRIFPFAELVLLEIEKHDTMCCNLESNWSLCLFFCVNDMQFGVISNISSCYFYFCSRSFRDIWWHFSTRIVTGIVTATAIGEWGILRFTSPVTRGNGGFTHTKLPCGSKDRDREREKERAKER